MFIINFRGNLTGEDMRKKSRDALIGAGIIFVTTALIFIMARSPRRKDARDAVSIPSSGQYVGLVELNGTIFSSSRITRLFKRYGESSAVKAVLFRINSPGGGIAPSQEIYNAVRRVRDGGKPVVVSMATVAASGGYYVACGADTIMANPGTTTGSIGVIAQIPDVSGLMDKIGVTFTSIKSGPYKDTGTPYRSLTARDKAYLQSWIDDAYEQFVDVVSEERELPREKVYSVADGRVFTGRQAMELGLVDLLGDYEDALGLAARMGHIYGKPQVLKERRRALSLADLLFQEAEGILHGLNGMIFLYKFI